MVFRWLRRWVRRSSRPIDIDTAHMWKRRLSLAYGILAWNALAFVGYAMYNGKRDWAAYHGIQSENQSPGKPATNMCSTKSLAVYPLSRDSFSALLLGSDGHTESQSSSLRRIQKEGRIRDRQHRNLRQRQNHRSDWKEIQENLGGVR